MATRSARGMGIGTQLVLWIGAVVAAAVLAITLVIAFRSRAVLLREGMERGSEVAARWAADLQGKFNEVYDVALTWTRLMESFARSDTPNKREEAALAMEHFIRSEPRIFDVYATFEPDAFDGDDAAYAGRPGEDPSGRFNLLVSRDQKGETVREIVADYDTPGVGDYYLIPKRTNKPAVIEPYLYPIQGVNVLMTSFVFPIQDAAGSFIGVAGIDIPLNRIQDLAASIKVDGLPSSYVNVQAAGGTIAANKNPEAVGQNVKEYYKGVDDLIEAVLTASEATASRYSTTARSLVYTFVHPIDIGGVSKWTVGVNILQTELLAAVRGTTTLVAVVGAGGLVLVLLAIVLYSRGLSSRVRLVTQGAQLLSRGDTGLAGIDTADLERLYRRRDETGETARAFRDLTAYLQGKAELAQRIADKDLSSEVSVSSERDALGKALEQMTHALNEFMGQALSAADQVGSGSAEVSSASQSLSQGATEQASSIEEISASVTQIAGQTRQNSDNAAQANQLSKSVMSSAEHGNERMKEMQEAMARIMSSSEEIKKVVKVIDDIAFQINLLALNANVEAARAGKYGKGFAVVAEEVRNLAVRSAQSVKETTEMAESSVKSTATGKEILEATATQLREILEGARKSADLVEEIASASKEQAQALEQITTGLSQIDQVTQANTASAEEGAAASEELTSQAQALRGMVAEYKLRAVPASAPEAAAPPQGGASPSRPRLAARAAAPRPQAAAKAVADPRTVIRLDDDQFGRF